MTVRDRVPSLSRGNPQHPALEEMSRALMEDQKRVNSSLPYNFGHRKNLSWP